MLSCPCKPCPTLSLPVSLGFFDDILIPPESLQQPAKLYPPNIKVGPVLRPLEDGPHSVVWPGSWGLKLPASAHRQLCLGSGSTDLPVLPP